MYILYAAGEIVLVMVGILLALQIDNWNENRKTAKEVNIYTEKLINDLVTDTLNINGLITNARIMQNNIVDYLTILSNLKADNIDLDTALVLIDQSTA